MTGNFGPAGIRQLPDLTHQFLRPCSYRIAGYFRSRSFRRRAEQILNFELKIAIFEELQLEKVVWNHLKSYAFVVRSFYVYKDIWEIEISFEFSVLFTWTT